MFPVQDRIEERRLVVFKPRDFEKLTDVDGSNSSQIG